MVLVGPFQHRVVCVLCVSSTVQLEQNMAYTIAA